MGEPPRRPRVTVDGVPFDPLTARQAVEHVVAQLRLGRGGVIVTPNVDIMRGVHRGAVGREITDADLILADGMPVIWASHLQGDPLPERVTGSSLVWDLCAAAAEHQHSVFLLGAAPGVADRAGARFVSRYPSLRIAGTHSPLPGFENDEAQLAEIASMVAASGARMVFLAFGVPKQERLAARLSADQPGAWYLCCGGSLDMAAGDVARAHPLVRKVGAEWIHRLAQEPRRLAKRYLVDDIPHASLMLARAAWRRRLQGAAEPPEEQLRPTQGRPL